MHRTDVAFSTFPIVMMLGLGALVLCLVAAAIAAASKKGTGGTLLSLLLCVGLLGGGLLSFAYMFTARPSLPIPNGNGGQGQYREMMLSQTVVPEPTFAILAVLGVVGLVLVLGVAGLVAAVRKGGGWVVLGLVLLGAPCLLLLLFAGARVSYMDTAVMHATVDEYHDDARAEMPLEMPLIEMGLLPPKPKPPKPPVAGEAIAEVTDWSDDDEMHADIDDVHGGHAAHEGDGHDAHGADDHTAHTDDSHGDDAHSGGHFDNLADSAILPSPKDDHKVLSHAPIILSKLPENHPEWIDQLDGKWDEGKKVWTQTVVIGPYEKEEECQRKLHDEVRVATKDFAEWHVAGIPSADAAIRNYNPDDLPGPWLKTRSYKGLSSGTTKDGRNYETRAYRRGHVRETYHTTVETSVSDEPMPVVFARVEFSQEYRDELNRSVRHGLSFQRAVKAGSVWGIGLLGLVATLGGLRLTGAKAAEPAVKPMAVVALADAAPLSRPKKLTRKRFMLILAPVICTTIYLISYKLQNGSADFWPAWVWLGCGIAFALTFMPGADKNQSAIKK